jgi:methionyl-tRNA formyltransferase
MTKLRIVLATPHSRYNTLEKVLCSRNDLEVIRIREREGLNLQVLSDFMPRFVFFPHWSWIIPAVVFERFECVIFHMSDVPFGRGGSPLQNLIDLGLDETWLSALRCDHELDAGPVYLKRHLSLLGSAEEILLRAAKLMEEMIATILDKQPTPEPQVGKPIVFKRRKPEQSNLHLETSLERVHDMIRMLDAENYPHAFIELGKLRFEFTRASLFQDHVRADVRITLIEQRKTEL